MPNHVDFISKFIELHVGSGSQIHLDLLWVSSQRFLFITINSKTIYQIGTEVLDDANAEDLKGMLKEMLNYLYNDHVGVVPAKVTEFLCT